MPTDLLSSPLTLPSGLVLPNRVVKSATTEGLADLRALPSEALLRVYRRWAAGGAGAIITGNVGISIDHPVRPQDVVLRRDSPLAPFTRWAAEARSGGAAVVMQLNHAGRQTPRAVNGRPIGPSTGPAVPMMGAFGRPTAATRAQIEHIATRHAEAAAMAEQAGFDGVQVHAAHGYLLSQFLSPDLNHRTDAWGGSVAKRARLLLDCVRAVRAATGPRFSIWVKLNAADFHKGGFTQAEALQVVAILDAESIDLLEISGGRYESGASFGHAVPPPSREAYFQAFAEAAREHTTTPLLLTGGLRSREAMHGVIASGVADAVGIARPMVLVPDYPARLLADRPVPSIQAPRLGVRRLMPAAELAWYYWQIARLGAGHDPDLSVPAYKALLWFALGDMASALRRRLLHLTAGSRPALTTESPTPSAATLASTEQGLGGKASS